MSWALLIWIFYALTGGAAGLTVATVTHGDALGAAVSAVLLVFYLVAWVVFTAVWTADE